MATMSMQEEEFLYLSTCTLLILSKSRKRDRRWWQREFLKKRKTHGAYNMLINELTLEDGLGFKNYCRMSTKDFENLLTKVAPLIIKKDTRLREAIPPADQLAVTLRFLATGDSFASLMYTHRMSKSSVCNIIDTVCEALVKVLAKEVQLPQNENEWLNVAKEYDEKWNFPHCLGTLDGKHIKIQAPPNSGSMFYNYKNYFSIVLLGIADANYKFLYANVGIQGRISDGGVLKFTSFYKKILTNSLNIPKPAPLPGRTEKTPYVFIADDAFALEENIIKPFPGHYPNNSWQRIFNYRTCRARRVIENTFGILSAVFRVLRTNMILSPEKATKVTLAAISVHNFLRNSKSAFYAPTGTFDTEDKDGNLVPGSWRAEIEQNQIQNLNKIRGRAESSTDNRREFAEYFCSNQGSVPWQHNM